MNISNFADYLNNLQEKKQNLISLAEKACNYGWINKSKADNGNSSLISLEEIKDKLAKDTLTIGVIGQMKCGKSTFLNSFIFEDDILPAATTPMTAALSIITYGEKEQIVAEFYTEDEWEEQKQQAERSLEDAGNSLDESKIKAAKELVSKSSKLGASLNSFLGKTQEDSFSNLIEYVGADGKYVSITKSVKIYYPKEYLKGVEIVDTPGFNDPIVSREERTKEFLKKADVVLMMLYAGRPFDATDRDIIFKNVRQCGIGKVLIGINKYDIPYCSDTNPEDESQIKDYVKNEIRKACRDCQDNTLVELLGEVEPIPLSAEMALLSELPMSKISNNDAFDFAWKRHCSNFGIGTQQEMRNWSHFDDLIQAVKDMVDKEKSKILFAKPLNAIMAAGNKINAENSDKLTVLKSKIELLRMPNNELDEREENLSKAHKRLSKKINALGEDIDEEIYNLIRKGSVEFEDHVDHTCKRMTDIIENEWGRFQKIESVVPKLESELQKLTTRTLKRSAQNLAEDGRRLIKRDIADFFSDAEDLLMRYLPDFDSRHFIKTTQKSIHLEIEDEGLFEYNSSDDKEDDTNVFMLLGNFGANFLNGFTMGLWGLANNVLNHSDNKIDALNLINEISADFDPQPYLESTFSSKQDVIDSVRSKFIKNLIEPLQEQIKEMRKQMNNKEQDLEETEKKISVLEDKKSEIESQITEISALKEVL